MNALSGPTDADLVARVLTADREAFALVYDRYGAKLYDFAYSMLRHREDAADAVADSFVTFAEKLPQLREPDRLRPWLYAIVRSECLRRLKARKRFSFDDDEALMAVPDDSLTPEASAERAALTKLVWDAAAGLADRDRALLDLHLRQGLEGAELGEAMGVSASNAYVMLTRLRGQVDRSLGALLVARLGRDDCDELDALLADWDGSFSPLIRKRVARHVDGCATCGERRKRMVSPWALLAGVPLFAAPAALRDRVLTDTRLVAYAAPGESVSVPAGRSNRVRNAVAGTAAAALLVGGAVVLWPDADEAAPAAGTPTSSQPPTVVPTPGPTTPTTPDADPTTAAPTPTAPDVPEPGTLAVSTGSIDLGRSARTKSFTVTNTGGAPVTFQVAGSRRWITTAPDSGTVQPGGSARVAVGAVRAGLDEGTSTGTVEVSWPSGSASVRVSARAENDPVVGRPSAADPTCTRQTVQARVRVTDESPLRSVRLTWTGPNGPGSATMSRSAGGWVAPMGPFTLGGTVTFRVTATDSRGNSSTGPAGTVDATPCPG